MRNIKYNKILSKVRGPIFIVGCPRSGTSMLVRILSSHDQINTIVGESSFYQTVYGNRLIYGRIGSKKNRRKLKEYLNKKINVKTEWHILDFNKWIENFLNLKGNNYLDLYRALMITFAQLSYSSKDDYFYIGDKNPSDIFFVKYLIHYFPNAKIINIVRDGRAVVASMLKGVVGPNNIISAVLTWKRYMQITKGLEKKILSSNYLRISYEGMVNNPEQTLNIVCNFLDIPFQQELLMTNLSGLSSFTNRNDRFIDTKRVLQYKNVLSTDQITLIEYIAEKELKEFGYLANKDFSVSSPSIKINSTILVRSIIIIINEFANGFSTIIGIQGPFKNFLKKISFNKIKLS